MEEEEELGVKQGQRMREGEEARARRLSTPSELRTIVTPKEIKRNFLWDVPSISETPCGEGGREGYRAADDFKLQSTVHVALTIRLSERANRSITRNYGSYQRI